MSKHFFWLTKDQFAKIEPHLPTDTRGVARVNDRRVISGIVHVLKSGGRWTDAPRDQYGPHKALYNRFVRVDQTPEKSNFQPNGFWGRLPINSVYNGVQRK